MEAESHRRIQQLFFAALERPPAERSAFLETSCREQPQLRREVEALLALDETGTGLLDTPVHQLLPGMDGELGKDREPAEVPQNQPLPERLGAYRILDRLGEGAMGVVYRAEQANPRRFVALKVLKPAVATAAMVRRFEFEIRVLGRLQHPGIAQIHEAGRVTADGTTHTFFAMELVQGQSLTDYVQSRGLRLLARMKLLAEVCDAVQHAHQKGVIHRDLKPANVLVTEAGQPKILDFGIARATDADLQRTTALQDAGHVIGTLSYMSPEQLSGDPLAIDTRADVFALGVMTFQLLADRLPTDLSGRNVAEALFAVTQQRPRRLGQLDRSLRGDPETMVHKAMHQDREQRYESAAAYAADLRRFLNREPIQAREPRLSYRLARFVQRNKALSIALVGLWVALLAGLLATWRQAQIAERERQAAETEASQRQKILGFLQDRVLARVNLNASGSKDVALVDILDEVVEEKESIFPEDPWTRAAVLSSIADSYASLGRAADWLSLCREVVTIQRQLLPPADPLLQRSLSQLGLALRENGELVEAERLLRHVWEIQSRELGPQHRLAMQAYHNWGVVLQGLGRTENLQEIFTTVVEFRSRELGPDHAQTLVAKSNLARFFQDQSDLQTAEQLMSEVLDGHRRTLGPQHKRTLVSMSILGGILATAGALERAEALLRECLQHMRSVLGPAHDDTLGAEFHLASLLQLQQRHQESVDLLSAALNRCERHGGGELSQAILRRELGASLLGLNRPVQAENHLRAALSVHERRLGPDHVSTLNARHHLGGALVRSGKLAEAEGFVVDTLASSESRLGIEHPKTLAVRHNLAVIRYEQGDYDTAERLWQEVLEAQELQLGVDHPATFAARSLRATALQQLLRNREAWQLLSAQHAYLLEHRGADHSETAQCAASLQDLQRPVEQELRAQLQGDLAEVGAGRARSLACAHLGRLLLQRDQVEEALDLLDAALESAQLELAEDDDLIEVLRLRLGVALSHQGLLHEAEESLRESWEILQQRHGPSHHYTFEARAALLALFEEQGCSKQEAQTRLIAPR